VIVRRDVPPENVEILRVRLDGDDTNLSDGRTARATRAVRTIRRNARIRRGRKSSATS
jgi:hypothetical protein